MASPRLITVFVFVLVLQSFLMKFSVSEIIPLLSVWDEILVLLMIPAAIAISGRFFLVWQGKFFFLLFALYFSVSILSSLFGVTELTQSLYQLVLDIKYVIILLFCLAAYREGQSEYQLSRIIKFLVLINIPFILLQFISPGVYDTLFPNGAHSGIFALQDGEALSRAAGVFWFTGLLAAFSVAALAFFVIKVLNGSVSRGERIFLCASLLLLISTLSRGEIVGFIFGFIAVYFVFYTKSQLKPLAVMTVLMVVISTGMYLDSYVQKAITELGLISTYDALAPRALFFLASTEIAGDFFPLGAGLGAFGGAAAVAYDSPLFYEYHIAHEWFFDHGLYLTDTYWPKIIAESGFIGALLHLIFLLFPCYFCMQKKMPSLAVCYSLMMIVFLLFNSISAPIYGSVFTVMISFFLIGGVISSLGSKQKML